MTIEVAKQSLKEIVRTSTGYIGIGIQNEMSIILKVDQPSYWWYDNLFQDRTWLGYTVELEISTSTKLL